MNIFFLIAAFGAGAFGTLIGGTPTFIMTGFVALAGGIAGLAGAADLATATMAFGSVFGPHVSFAAAAVGAAYAARKGYLKTGGADCLTALNGFAKVDVLLVGGFAGITGFVIQWFYANVCHFDTDTVAMTVVTMGILTRLIIGKTGLFGKYEDGEKRHFFTPGQGLYNLVMGLAIGVMVSGVAMYLMQTYPAATDLIVANYPTIFFAISAITLIFCLTSTGATTPATHHITITCANAAVLSGNFAVGVLVAVIATFMGDFMGNVFNSHNDSHIDPPALTIFPLTFIIFALFK